MIRCYEDFVEALLAAGFSMGGGNDEGIYALIPWNWNEEPPYETPVSWHTGDRETDPWEWRMRVLDERNDIAYGKLFLKKSGYITRAWYPHFWALRRGGLPFDEAYQNGVISFEAKRIYDVLREHGTLPLHALKPLSGFSKENQSRFDKALVELQARLYVTMCGRQQKLSQKGEEYGWSSTVFCLPEAFFGDDIAKEAARITPAQATEKITGQILRLNPEAQPKKIARFIGALV